MASDCPNCTAAKISVHGMYEMHLFTPIPGRTPGEVIQAWREHNATPNPATVGGQPIDDLGKAMLCSVIVMTGDGKELRRVGAMVFPDSDDVEDQVERWQKACEGDADVVRLLAERAA